MGGWVGLVGACFDQSLIGQIVWWSNRLTTMVDEPWVGLVGSFECWPLATLRRAVAGPWRAVAPPRPPRQTIQPDVLSPRLRTRLGETVGKAGRRVRGPVQASVLPCSLGHVSIVSWSNNGPFDHYSTAHFGQQGRTYLCPFPLPVPSPGGPFARRPHARRARRVGTGDGSAGPQSSLFDHYGQTTAV